MSDSTFMHLRVSGAHTITCKTRLRSPRNAPVKNLEFQRTLGMKSHLPPNQSMKPTGHCEKTSACLPPTPPVAYLCLVRRMKPVVGAALLLLAVRCAHAEHIDIATGGSCSSPDKRYQIVVASVEPTKMPGLSAVFLRFGDSGKQSLLFRSEAGGRGIDIFWSPDSSCVAINSYEANSGDSLHVFRVHGASATRLRKPAYDATERKLLTRHPKFGWIELNRWSLYAKQWRDSQLLDTIMRGEYYAPGHSLETFAFIWTIRLAARNRFAIVHERVIPY
jgi:hypothetical protein